MELSLRQVAVPARDALLTAVAAVAVTGVGSMVGPQAERFAAVGALGGIGGLALWFGRYALKAAQNETRQLEGLIQLQRILPLIAPAPATRGWAASPDLLLLYVQEILRGRPDVVVECGSGVSTLYSALALESVGASGKVVAIDHDPEYAEKTRAMLADHGVSHRAEVRVAPIRTLTLDGEQRPWYDVSVLEGLDKIGLLFVDGPLGTLHHESRYPALALLRERLLPGATVVLDDSDREGETAVVEHWQARFPELEVAKLPTEKGTVLLRVPH